MGCRYHRFIVFTLIVLAAFDGHSISRAAESRGPISAANYATLQAAVDANPGRAIHVPDGDYQLDRELRITADHTELFGSGRLIQTNPDCSIIRVEGAAFVRLTGLTLTRPSDKLVTSQEGITVIDSRFVEIDAVRVLDNRGPAGSIRMTGSRDCTIRDCLIYNYMFVTVEDRTSNPSSGIAFRAIDGTGIVIVDCVGTLVSGNRVVDENTIPTQEFQAKHDLGRIVERANQRGLDVDPVTWERGVVGGNWHQGSGIYVNGDRIRVVGNYIRNAAQGIDVQGDHVGVDGNVFDNCAVGIKVIHGSKCDLITNNQIVAPSLWGIVVASGSNSRYATAATDGEPALEANLAGQVVIANNIVSEFGSGNAAWIWHGNHNQAAIFLTSDRGRPPLRDVIVSGNVVLDHLEGNAPVDGEPRPIPDHFEYAVRTGEGEAAPSTLRFSDNILYPGRLGISNHVLRNASEEAADSINRK